MSPPIEMGGRRPPDEELTSQDETEETVLTPLVRRTPNPALLPTEPLSWYVEREFAERADDESCVRNVGEVRGKGERLLGDVERLGSEEVEAETSLFPDVLELRP
jgi:hypothetical protein